MELFPAADDETWEFIKEQIDDSDYYVLLIAGRYGSLADDGLSYTEKEYDYARSINKPIIAFVHADRSKIEPEHLENNPSMLVRLDRFTRKVLANPVRQFENRHQLALDVAISFHALMRRRPAVGYVKANTFSDLEQNRELLEHAKSVGVTAMYDEMANFGGTDQWNNLMASAKREMDLMGRTLHGWLGQGKFNDILFNKIDQDDVRFRWLIMSPENQHLDQLEEDGKNIGETIKIKIDPVFEVLRAVRKRLPEDKKEHLQVRKFHRVPLYFSSIRVDDKYLITSYLQSASSKRSPMIVLNGRSSHWARTYDGEFNMVWKSAVDIFHESDDSDAA
jgi:uncharacterized protein (UPF0128 family)